MIVDFCNFVGLEHQDLSLIFEFTSIKRKFIYIYVKYLHITMNA